MYFKNSLLEFRILLLDMAWWRNPYGVSTGQGNVMVGYNSGGTCISGIYNTFLGANTALVPGQIYLSWSIALGEGVVITESNQLMVAPYKLFLHRWINTKYRKWRGNYTGV